MKEQLEIVPLGEEQLDDLAHFMRAHGNAHAEAEHLRHWYLGNPTGSSSVMLGLLNGRVVGMATTNDHYFNGPDGRALVAMPQKVLTDASLRGQGIFGNLYKASEEVGRRKGVGFFLTVTNAASTPIFLQRFGYQRLPSPRMLVVAPALGPVRGAAADVPWTVPAAVRPDAWTMEKEEAHMRWRFGGAGGVGRVDQAFRFADGSTGRLFLKRIKRKGVPLLLLLDGHAADDRLLRMLLVQARRIARRQGCVALLVLAEERMVRATSGMLRHTVSSGLNLLVKGLDEAHTTRLLRQRFSIAFGDLDFL